MYHGIIQVGNFAGPGHVPAREDPAVRSRQGHSQGPHLAAGLRRRQAGSIGRLVRDRIVPRMNNETPAQLVTHLSHPNGWWRDTAQQLLVLKQDKSVVPALLPIADDVAEPAGALPCDVDARRTGRAQAGARAPADEGPRAADAHPGDSRQRDALQGGRPIVRRRLRGDDEGRGRRRRDPGAADDQPLEGAGRSGDDQDGDGGQPGARRAGRGDHDAQSAGERRRTRRGAASLPSNRAQFDRGGQIYNELCFACHGPDAMGTPKPELATTMAPALAGSPRVNGHRDYIIKVVLNGLAGPVDGKTYTDMMIPMGSQNDEWIAAVGSFVRNNFGNSGGFITPADVARVRAATAGRKALWTLPELAASMPTALFTDGWKLTASHNAGRGRRRAAPHRVERRRAATGRDVVPGGAARSRRWSPRSSSSRRRQAVAAARGMPPPSPRAERRSRHRAASRAASRWRSRRTGRRGRRRLEGTGTRPDDHQHVRAGPGEVRSDQPDVERRGRARVVRPESQNLRHHEA